MLEQTKKYKIAVIIVNYNVAFFLEQCLNSVQKALSSINGQVFVVDNNSIDGSVEMVKQKFPDFNLIANKDNKGFSKANNQAIVAADAEYILLLNPDTVLEEDCLSKTLEFMDAHHDAGGLGVRMLDGKGQFLPESKRGLPTPIVAFYKIFGLSLLFPKSKKFGQYHLGHLSEFETNEVDVLSGAFMLMRSKTLDEVGLLDEAFFMYGEDIDLSYRIQKGGYKNYYFPETRIIHYKGESTKKSSINYVFVFYRAMVIFAEKHFSQKNAKLFSVLIHTAIYLRASLAIGMRFIRKAVLPLIDYTLLYVGLYFLAIQWRISNILFPAHILQIAIPSYTLVWLTSIFYSGGYDKPIRLTRFLKGSFIGTLLLLIIYGLLPKEWQFSRLYMLVGALWTSAYFVISRVVLHLIFKGKLEKKFDLNASNNKKFAVIGDTKEFNRVAEILRQTNPSVEAIAHVSAGEEKEEGAIGTISQLDQIVHIHGMNEIVFCAKDTAAQTIIHWMTIIDSRKIDFKIAQPDSLSLIGSNSIDTAGDLYVLNINAITKPENIRNKRTFDVSMSFLFLLSLPVTIWFFSKKMKFIQNLFSIAIGRNSFVGYLRSNSITKLLLPTIKSGILTPNDSLKIRDEELYDKLNLIYARDYGVQKDFWIVWKAWKQLDR
jgi:GT2 family glycosyltransferase